MKTGFSCVIDASVVIKIFLQEDLSEEVQQIIDDNYLNSAEPASLIVPDLLFVECANILRSKVRFDGYPPKQALEALHYLRSLALPATSNAELIEEALAIALIYEITAYDAIYVALTAQNNIPLLTADARLVQRLQGSPYDLISIEDYLSTST